MPRQWTATYGVFAYVGGRLVSFTRPICDVAGSNYVGVYGVGEPGVDGDGVFFRNVSVRLQDVTDGSSNTFSVGERSISLNGGRGRATWTGAVPSADFWSCAPNPNDPDAGGTCVDEQSAGMTLGHTGEGHGPGDPHGDSNQFLSRHGRGAFFLFCDGHVRYIQGSIDYALYKALSTRAGGEAISSDY